MPPETDFVPQLRHAPRSYLQRGAALQRELDKYSKVIKLRQGENGAPSGYIPSFALDKYYSTEYTQAKYNLRRMLGDLCRGIETEVFTIIDLRYAAEPPVLKMKGLIQSYDIKGRSVPRWPITLCKT